MAFEFMSTADTSPDILVVYLVGVFGCDVDITVAEGSRNLFGPAFPC